MQLIWVKREAKYFFGKDWTVDSALIGLAKFDFWRKWIFVSRSRRSVLPAMQSIVRCAAPPAPVTQRWTPDQKRNTRVALRPGNAIRSLVIPRRECNERARKSISPCIVVALISLITILYVPTRWGVSRYGEFYDVRCCRVVGFSHRMHRIDPAFDEDGSEARKIAVGLARDGAPRGANSAIGAPFARSSKKGVSALRETIAVIQNMIGMARSTYIFSCPGRGAA